MVRLYYTMYFPTHYVQSQLSDAKASRQSRMKPATQIMSGKDKDSPCIKSASKQKIYNKETGIGSIYHDAVGTPWIQLIVALYAGVSFLFRYNFRICVVISSRSDG